MTSKQDQAAQLLRLPDADYFSFDQDRQLKLQAALARLVNNGGSGAASRSPEPIFAVGSPTNIDVDQHSSIPVLIGLVQSGLRAWQVNFKPNLHLFVRNLSTGELSVAKPLVDMRRGKRSLPSGAGTPPERLQAGTLYGSVSLVNLRDKLDDAVKPGRLSVTAIVNELRSNSVAIRLQSSAPLPPPTPPGSPQSYVQYEMESRAEFATQVDVPKTASQKDGIPIRVAIQMNAGAEVQKATAGQPFWSFHLILIKLDEKPVIIPATVPVREISSGGRLLFNASFEVDVRAAAKSQLNGKYQVYIDAGREFLGPYPLSVSH